jgi:hypothetical protein
VTQGWERVKKLATTVMLSGAKDHRICNSKKMQGFFVAFGSSE